MAVLAITKSATQGADLNLEVSLFDKCLRPGAGYQIFLCHHLASAFDEGGQDIKGTAAQPDRLVALKQEPLGSKQPEWAK
jgi:hypothetical protein